MRFSIPIAEDSPLEFMLRDAIWVADCSHPKGASETPWKDQFAACLQNPVGYLPLQQMVLPGDKLVIAVDPETPQAATVLSMLLTSLIAAGSLPEEIQVLVAQEQRDALQMACMNSCPEAWQTAIEWLGHDPTAENDHAYLAGTHDGRPLYLHRALCEADVVIPLGVTRSLGLINDLGVHGSWYPRFSNLEAQHRFFSAGNIQWETHHRRRREEINEAAWMLGVQFVVQLMPGPAGTVLKAWCGEAAEVTKQMNAEEETVWTWHIEREVDVAISVLDGPEYQQTWRNVAQALQVATRVVREGGAIILWTNLTTPPGPALTSLARAELTAEEHQLTLLKLRSADATAAKIIGDCLDTHRIFMRSKLEGSFMEDIGMGALHTVSELERLLHEHESCVVIGSAQHASVKLIST